MHGPNLPGASSALHKSSRDVFSLCGTLGSEGASCVYLQRFAFIIANEPSAAPLMQPLLSRYALCSTTDPDLMEGVLRQNFGITRFELGSPANDYRGRTNLWQPERDISLTYAECDGDVTLTLPGSDAVRLYIGLGGQTKQGSSGSSNLISDGDVSLIGQDASSVTHYREGSRLLVMRVDQSKLKSTMSALVGRNVADDIVFRPDCSAQRRSTRAVRQLVLALASHADGASEIAPALTRSLTEIILVSLLTAAPHNWSMLLERPVPLLGRPHLRRAEEYIRANWHQPLTVEEIAHHAGCSTRSLFKSFQTVHGVGPIVFLRRVRLEHARALLSDPTNTVADVGLRCGFSNLGHFARYYQERFGILPSQTLRLARRGC